MIKSTESKNNKGIVNCTYLMVEANRDWNKSLILMIECSRNSTRQCSASQIKICWPKKWAIVSAQSSSPHARKITWSNAGKERMKIGWQVRQECKFAFQISCSRVPLRCLFEICLFVVDSDCRPGQRPPPAIAYSNAIKIAALDLQGCLFEIRLFVSVCPAWTRGTESTRTPVPGLREKVSETAGSPEAQPARAASVLLCSSG